MWVDKLSYIIFKEGDNELIFIIIVIIIHLQINVFMIKYFLQ